MALLRLRSAAAATCMLLLMSACAAQAQSIDYKEALSKAILFFEQQRSGRLPPNQRAKWRGDSGSKDGKDVGLDLSGGYFDSGDNVKFGLPLGFALSSLGWGLVDFRRQLLATGQLSYALAALKWGTDYLIKAHPEPNVLYVQVGEGESDHSCWQRPEDMTTPRKSFKIDTNTPGTEVAAESAAALAAASIVFRGTDKTYAYLCLVHAKQLFEFADKYRGTYTSAVPDARTFYNSFSGFKDELLWAAAWLYRATNLDVYLKYLVENADSLGGTTSSPIQFSWDDKNAGVQILMTKVLWSNQAPQYSSVLSKYKDRAVNFICHNLKYAQRTPGGMIFIQPWSSVQYVTSASLTVALFADYLTTAKQTISCGGETFDPADLISFVKSQMDYILGKNPKGLSYMVGFGSKYPQQPHHRGASLPSIFSQRSFIGCGDGFSWFNRPSPNPNVLVGAFVGGPDAQDKHTDSRQNYQGNEPSLYLNAPAVGALARLAGGASTGGSIREPEKVASPPRVVTGLKPRSPFRRTPRASPRSPVRRTPRATPRSPLRRSPAIIRKSSPRVVRRSPSAASGKYLKFEISAGSMWAENGVKKTQYSVNVRNISGRNIRGYLIATRNFNPSTVWGITKQRDGRYKPQSYGSVLAPNQVYNFGFIYSGTFASSFLESSVIA